MFLPTISDCVPSIEAWQAQWKARQQAKIESESSAKKIKVNFEVFQLSSEHGADALYLNFVSTIFT